MTPAISPARQRRTRPTRRASFPIAIDQLLLRRYSFQFVLRLLCAAFYCQAAELEDAPRLLWAGLSVLVYLVTWMLLSWGLIGCLVGQVGLFGAITLVSVIRKGKV